MDYFKHIENGYLIALETERGDVIITESEYDQILSLIRNRPNATDGYQYRLRADTLEWELVKLPPIEPEPLTDEQALTRYANELTGQNDPDLISAAETLITDRIKEE